jgi:hypothetical protein
MIRGIFNSMGRFFGQHAANLTNFTGYGSGVRPMIRGIRNAAPKGIKATGSAAVNLFNQTWVKGQQPVFRDALRTQSIDAGGMSILGLGNYGPQEFGGNLRHGVVDYLSGMNYRDQVMAAMNRGGANLQMDVLGMRRRMMTRLAVPGMVGAGMASSALLGEDSIVSKGARLGAGVAVHGAVGTGLAFMAHPAIGGAYLGMAAWNGIRSVNNIGPF